MGGRHSRPNVRLSTVSWRVGATGTGRGRISVACGERGAGHPPLAFGSVAWCGASPLERRGCDLTGGARGVPRAPLPDVTYANFRAC